MGLPGRAAFVTALFACIVGCGARTALIDDPPEPVDRPEARPEECNGLDDDLDGLRSVGALDGGMDGGVSPADGGDTDLRVDEDFRDELGRYVLDARHCGGCNRPCALAAPALGVDCALIEDAPRCVATRCEPGFTVSFTGVCVPTAERLCLECADDGDCGDFEGASCVPVAGERRCTIDCDLGCPDGYTCESARGFCVPAGGSCSCDPGDSFELACALFDPDEARCPGAAVCADGVLGECLAPVEVCDETDNDCDGIVDEEFRDARGAYILDLRHCGECGIDCTESSVPEGDLICGGDPFAPSCVLACPDVVDGIQVGDRVDADRVIATGCECTVSSPADEPGPVGAVGEALDVNCDGADGIVVESFYVAPDGEDGGVGSPTRPLRTLGHAFERASESLESGMPRPHIFVAAGTYAESLTLPDGVFLHGGYRRDFLTLDPAGFVVEVRAPLGTASPGGAALVTDGAGSRPTVVEWMRFKGRDAESPGEATFGAYLVDAGAQLTLREIEVSSGAAGDGEPGLDGRPGVDFERVAEDGDPPRGAVETDTRECARSPENTVRAGRGGVNICDGIDVSGGDGGSTRCPTFAAFQPGGGAGRNGGGAGGDGGQDSEGPITGSACRDAPVCCGLADFTVPSDFRGPQPGQPGSIGRAGSPGFGCTDPFGSFEGDAWVGNPAGDGTGGRPGSGGGGGGGGGGAVLRWTEDLCEFADGLGGGGGGGGAGGCGGTSGSAGSSGAPSVAVLLRFTEPPASLPRITDVTVAPSDGGRGGDGGTGGAGGRGSSGGFGGELPRESRSTPTLAGPFPGGRGGLGGRGGDGGGGGGGCGGGSVGIWLLGGREGDDVNAWRSGNRFDLGRAGLAGRGGGGAAPGADGAEGVTVDVVVR